MKSVICTFLSVISSYLPKSTYKAIVYYKSRSKFKKSSAYGEFFLSQWSKYNINIYRYYWNNIHFSEWMND